MTEQVPEPLDGKPVLMAGKDFLVLSRDNIPEVEEFVGAKLEVAQSGWYGFRNDGRSRRVFIGDHLMLDGERVIIWPVKNFKDTYDVEKPLK